MTLGEMYAHIVGLIVIKKLGSRSQAQDYVDIDHDQQ